MVGRGTRALTAGHRRARARAQLTRAVAAGLISVIALGCTNTRFNAVAPGAEVQEPPSIPDAVDIEAAGFTVHLDPTVLLWARDAKLDLRTIVRGAVTRIEDRLHGSRAQISISAGSYRVIPDVGIGGSTDARTGEVLVSMDARSSLGLRTMLRTWLPLALAHELHHSTRVLDGPGFGTTLLDTIVSEGGAEAFVAETYPDAPKIPWVQPLSVRDERRVWHEARDAFARPDDTDVYERWFLGKHDLPRWTGYRLGYEIVRGYLKTHAGVTAADIATLQTDEIFAGSGYTNAAS